MERWVSSPSLPRCSAELGGRASPRRWRRAPASGRTRGADGAHRAVGGARGADSRTEVHQGLIELPCRASPSRKQAAGKVPYAPLGCRRSARARREGPAEDTCHVRVHGRRAVLVREARNGARGVPTDAREGRERFRVVGDRPAMVTYQDPGEAVEIRSSAVIPESVPRLANLRGRRVGQVVDRGILPDEAGPVVDHTRDLSLLQHELGHQDSIRIARCAPRQVPTLAPEPGEETACERQSVGGSVRRRFVAHGRQRYTAREGSRG